MSSPAAWTRTPACMSLPRPGSIGGLLGVQEFPAAAAGYASRAITTANG